MFAVAIAEHGEGRLPSIDVPEGGAWELYVVFAICWDTSAESAIRGLLRIAAEEMERVIPCWKTACFYDVEQAQSQIEYVLSKSAFLRRARRRAADSGGNLQRTRGSAA